MVGGAVSYIGIKLTLHSLEREGGAFCPFCGPHCPRWTVDGGLQRVVLLRSDDVVLQRSRAAPFI